MKCPTDGSVLVISDRSGIEIDYCPECRGVWLDRGELDKIIDRSLSNGAVNAPQPGTPYPPAGYDGRGSKHGSGHGDRNGHDGYQQNGRKRGGWFGDLFD